MVQPDLNPAMPFEKLVYGREIMRSPSVFLVARKFRSLLRGNVSPHEFTDALNAELARLFAIWIVPKELHATFHMVVSVRPQNLKFA